MSQIKYKGKVIDTYFVLHGLWNGEDGMKATTCGFGKQQPDGWYWLLEGMDDGEGPVKSEAAAIRNAKDQIDEDTVLDREPYTMQDAVKEYSWLGKVLAVHTVGRYDLVEYRSNTDDDVHYGVCVDSKRTSYTATTIERALLTGIALAHDPAGVNSQAMTYAARILYLPEIK